MSTTDLRFKIGLVINPISGMGGSVGLKGTDGDIFKQALNLGAKPSANKRTKEYLQGLIGVKEKITILTPPGIMGGDICIEMEFYTEIIDESKFNHPIRILETSQDDTINAVKFMKNKVDLLVFVGGDGTARDVFSEIGQEIPCLGVPSGVKIHSSVFSLNPVKASQLTMEFLWGEAPLREAEILDINEEAFRDNRVVSKLYGYVLTPYSPVYSQPSKMASPTTQDEYTNQESIAKWIIEEMEQDSIYIIGPGTTTKKITDLLDQKKTLLGVDLMKNRKIIAMDLNEQGILNKIHDENCKIIVTPIGQQGFIFGRGNLQLSNNVIKKIKIENIIIICTKYKLNNLVNNQLHVDTRDPDLDDKMKGMYRVLVDYGEYRIGHVE